MNNEEMSDMFEKLNGVIDKDKISPDMVNNLLSMLGNNSSSDEANNNNSANTSEQVTSNKTSDTSNSSLPFGNGIDIETLLKMKSIMDKMNVKDDPRSNLLQSLKPYLKESRKSKLDQYIQFMNMSKFINVFPFMGGGKKKDG